MQREREREIGSDMVALKLAMILHFPLPKTCNLVPPFSNCARAGLTLSPAKKCTLRNIRILRSASLKWQGE